MERKDLARFDLPDCPGVYLFTKGRGKSKEVLYIGKATSLRDRVRSYFDDDLIATRGPRVVDVITRADAVSYETAPTVLEALVREAALIRQYLPIGNVEGKDDKTFLYAYITDEEVPRVLTARGKDVDFEEARVGSVRYTAIHGPFPSGPQLREALRLIRRIFPFYDTPKPIGYAGKHQRARVEFNKQIGHYPKEVEQKAYLRSVRNVSLFLSGRVKALRETLMREMKQAAKEERFEDAAQIRKQLFALDHVQDVSLIREERPGERAPGPRIEAYDTAHISGTNTIGVMTVVEDGVAVRREYRTFKVRTSKNDDIKSLKEILSRRLGHPEWQMPKVFVVDGGKTHKKAAEEVLAEAGVMIPVVAVIKDEKHRPREVIGALRAGITEADAVLANAEAHRFALAGHRKARQRGLRKKA